ncbi:MAG: glycerol-3-phosphate 1-O-acyltransferase PlsY [Clostridia bacterium]|nr:glycerol-3-phosphate 1-O-acyltransferase PlsY [Clostridia bacterium]
MNILQEGFLSRILASGAVSDETFFFFIKPFAVLLMCVVIPYLLGSVNSAIIVSKVLFRDDIRRHGSGNGGATNMLRTYGAKGAIPTILGDVLKTALAVLIGALCCGFWSVAGFSFVSENASLFILSAGQIPLISGTYLAGAFCIFGHVFPVFYRFKGGKGVLSSLVVALMLNLWLALLLLLIFVIMVAFTRYISLGSTVAAALYPVFLSPVFRALFFGDTPPIYMMLFSFFLAGVIILKHIPNIKRILRHEESKFSFRRVPKFDDQAENTEDQNGGQ